MIVLVGVGVWPKHARCGNFVELNGGFRFGKIVTVEHGTLRLRRKWMVLWTWLKVISCDW